MTDGGRTRAFAILIATQFIAVHGVDGQTFFLNPPQIATLREPVGDDRKHFPRGTRCVVVMSSGKFVPVLEQCSEVRDLATRPAK